VYRLIEAEDILVLTVWLYRTSAIYLYIMGFILLVAMVGAVVLCLYEDEQEQS
jgi:hypothetical protein